MVTNIGGLPVREDVIVTIAGTVVAFREEDFYSEIVPEKFGRTKK